MAILDQNGDGDGAGPTLDSLVVCCCCCGCCCCLDLFSFMSSHLDLLLNKISFTRLILSVLVGRYE